jgi:hypothetical protein
MPSRPGLTVLEVLIAASLGVLIVGVSISQLMEFFRLQQVLTVRAQLRHDTKNAQERIAQKLRYAAHVLDDQVDDGAGGLESIMIAVIPVDTCADGYYCSKDEVEVVCWGAALDPLNPGRAMATEKSVTLSAFALPGDIELLKPLFKSQMGRGRLIGPYVKSIGIDDTDPRMYTLTVHAERELPRQPKPIAYTFTEKIAHRYLPSEESGPALPSLEEAIEKLDKAPIRAKGAL